MPFYTGGVNLNDFFFTDEDLVNQYIGGRLWLWGGNSASTLGDNTTVNRSSPVQTVTGGTNWKQVSCGFEITAAIKTDGTLWLWGSNFNGTLGDNTTLGKGSPVQTVTRGTNWKQVSCGYRHNAAVKTDGTLWLWGAGANGALGDNTTANKSSPVQTVTGGTNWKQVSCGNRHTAAVKTDGTLWLWGAGANGRIGDNTAVDRSSPVQAVTGGTNWKQVSCGTSVTLNAHTAAVKTDGTLWLWGLGAGGQLGDNTVNSYSSPVQTVAAGTNWSQVSCGYRHTAAVKTDGTLWSWGQGNLGQIGNSLVNRSSPVQTVTGGTNWKQVAAGGEHSAAVKTDGTLWTWGGNTFGLLGINLAGFRNSPIQTIAFGFNWKQVSCGWRYSAATQDNG